MKQERADRIQGLADKAFGRKKIKRSTAERLFAECVPYTRAAAWKSARGSGRPNDWEDLSQECLLSLFDLFRRKGPNPHGLSAPDALKLKTKSRLTNGYRDYRRGPSAEILCDMEDPVDHEDLDLVRNAAWRRNQHDPRGALEQRAELSDAVETLSATERRFVKIWMEEDGINIRVASRLGLAKDTCQRFGDRTFLKLRGILER